MQKWEAVRPIKDRIENEEPAPKGFARVRLRHANMKPATIATFLDAAKGVEVGNASHVSSLRKWNWRDLVGTQRRWLRRRPTEFPRAE
jgi:hypothetical protein